MWGTEGEQSFSNLGINSAKRLHGLRIWKKIISKLVIFGGEKFVGTTYMQGSVDNDAVHENCCVAYMPAQK